MKVIDTYSDLSIILKHSRVSKDSRINDKFLLSRFNAYRSKEIRDSFTRNIEIDPMVLQDMGETTTTEIGANDPDMTGFTLNTKIGKFSIPTVVSLTGDKGIHSIAPPNRLSPFKEQYYYTAYNTFGQKVTHPEYCTFKWFTRINNHVYIYPYKKIIRPVLILDNPMEGYAIQTHTPPKNGLIYQTAYAPGESYTIVSGGITHNGINYLAGGTFIAQNPDYQGNGLLEFTDKKRRMTVEDEYPISYTMTEVIIMKILTKDFALEKDTVADIVNNANDDLLILKQR